MNRFIIMDGLPYLYADGHAYAVRWDDEGFTVGAEVAITSAPDVVYTELSIMAKCAADLDSIKAEPVNEDDVEAEESTADETTAEPVNEDDVEMEKPLSEMSLAELKEYAKAHDVKLGSARTKEAIIDAIAEALI